MEREELTELMREIGRVLSMENVEGARMQGGSCGIKGAMRWNGGRGVDRAR